MRRSPPNVLSILLAAALLSCGEAPKEDGDAKVTRLDPGALPALRDSFNAAEGSVRVLVMLSPT
jgi:hypothetical protein